MSESESGSVNALLENMLKSEHVVFLLFFFALRDLKTGIFSFAFSSGAAAALRYAENNKVKGTLSNYFVSHKILKESKTDFMIVKFEAVGERYNSLRPLMTVLPLKISQFYSRKYSRFCVHKRSWRRFRKGIWIF